MTAHCGRIDCMAGRNAIAPRKRDVLNDIWIFIQAGIKSINNSWKTRRRQQRELNELSDRDLKDIGITRHDLGNRPSSHFWYV